MNSDLKMISPFKKFCITIGNLPTAYLESMSYYESLTFLVNFLSNEVIPTVNNNSEVTKEIQAKFTELKNYVDSYFENLDVQEEINNKLDEMAESGELTDIIAQYLGLAGMITFNNVSEMKAAENLVNGSKCTTLGFYSVNDGGGATYYIRNVTNSDTIDEKFIVSLFNDNLIAQLIVNDEVNLKQIGAKNDYSEDQTSLIQSAIDYCGENNITKIYVPEGIYKITDTLNVEFSNLTIYGNNNSVLKYYGVGYNIENPIKSINLIEIKGTNSEDYIENIKIKNIKFDCTEQEYKGGKDDSHLDVTSPKPFAWGITAIRGLYVLNLSVNDCSFIDIYGDGIIVNHSTNLNLSNNYFKDVGAGWIVSNLGYYDFHGDAITCYFDLDVIMNNNTIINTRLYQENTTEPNGATALGKPCGRSGLEYEYSLNADSTGPTDTIHNAPLNSIIPADSAGRQIGVKLQMKNNFVYGYTKGIHLESGVRCDVSNNTLLKNHIAIMLSVDSDSIISENYIDNYNVGKAPQIGYDDYSGGIAVSQYASLTANEDPKGNIISNNIIRSTLKGIVIGHSNVTITNNLLRCKFDIQNIVENIENIIISNNTFAKSNDRTFSIGLNLTNNVYINDNIFDSETSIQNTVRGNNIQFNNNTFKNNKITHNGGNDFKIINNKFIFDNDNNASNVIALFYPKYCSIVGNNIDLSNVDNYKFIYTSGTIDNSTINDNNIKVSNTRTTHIIELQTGTYNKINGNNISGNTKDQVFVKGYVSKSYIIENNNCDEKCIIFNTTGSFNGVNQINNNNGYITASGYKPNDELALIGDRFVDRAEKIYRYNISNNSTSLGWICVSEGFYPNTSWTSGNTYTAGRIVKNASNNVYKCITAGSGTVSDEPTHITGSVTESDGYTWDYLGPIAVFKSMTI